MGKIVIAAAQEIGISYFWLWQIREWRLVRAIVQIETTCAVHLRRSALIRWEQFQERFRALESDAVLHHAQTAEMQMWTGWKLLTSSLRLYRTSTTRRGFEEWRMLSMARAFAESMDAKRVRQSLVLWRIENLRSKRNGKWAKERGRSAM